VELMTVILEWHFLGWSCICKKKKENMKRDKAGKVEAIAITQNWNHYIVFHLEY
jgi:hypothetical protein